MFPSLGGSSNAPRSAHRGGTGLAPIPHNSTAALSARNAAAMQLAPEILGEPKTAGSGNYGSLDHSAVDPPSAMKWDPFAMKAPQQSHMYQQQPPPPNAPLPMSQQGPPQPGGPTVGGLIKEDAPQTARQMRQSGHGSQKESQGGSMSSRPASKPGGWSSKQGVSNPAPSPDSGNKGSASLPLTPAKVLKYHIDELTDFEQGEILDFPQVWFFGAGAQKVRGTASTANNHAYDDERGDYCIILNDHILYRYEVMNPLGKGSFGQVVRTYDYKTNAYSACKMIRNKKRFHHQALVEVKILEQLKERDVENTSNIVHMLDSFYFRNHLCITFELLSINLYEFIKNNNFRGVSLGLIRRFAIQLLTALRFLRKQRVIHCDFKPENVLLKNPTKSGIKVIDFGSSCLEDERVYTYIQSRFYRAPEVILGIPYDVAIDMWSFGCILAELYTGYPLYPGENEVEQLLCIMEVGGLPPQNILDQATRVKMFFDAKGSPRIVPNSRGKKRRPGTKDLQMAIRTSETKFVHFLQGCLMWDPRERLIPEDALRHDWILEGYAKQPAQSSDGQEHSSSSRRKSHRNKSEQVQHSMQQTAGQSFAFPPINAGHG